MKWLVVCLGILTASAGCGSEEDDATLTEEADLDLDIELTADSLLAEPGTTIELDVAILILQQGGETDDWDARAAVIRKIGSFGPDAGKAIPLLREALADNGDHWLVRCEAVCALAAIGPETLSDLQAALVDRHPRVRRTAAYALGQIDSEPDQVVPLLREALQDSDWQVSAEAARSLAAAGPQAVAELQAALKAPDARVQAAAAWSLGQLGPQAAAAIPDLRTCLAEGEWLARSAAVYALGQMGPQTIPDLLAATQDESWGVRSAAEQVLKDLGREDLLEPSETVEEGDQQNGSVASPPIEATDLIETPAVAAP